nr:toprim domain-containing protein [Candidatus Sigynarchaeota archaeon]
MNKDEVKRKRKEDLTDLFKNLALEASPILVEGKRDKEALVRAGIDGSRIFMHHGKSRIEVEESIGNASEVIMMLDYDAEGLKMLDELKAIFESSKIRVNTRYWSKIREIFNGHIDCIENLRGYFDP